MDEKASTTIGFFCRARAFLTAHGTTSLVRVITDNGANYRARAFTTTIVSLASRHQRIHPYTPRDNGKGQSTQTRRAGFSRSTLSHSHLNAMSLVHPQHSPTRLYAVTCATTD